MSIAMPNWNKAKAMCLPWQAIHTGTDYDTETGAVRLSLHEKEQKMILTIEIVIILINVTI